MSQSEPVLEVQGISKKFMLVELERLLELNPREVFRSIEAVRDVSFSVGRGQVYGFLGPNGAGKTTTIKMCMDLIRPTSGTIRLLGSVPGDPAVKARIGYLPEHPYFYDYLTAQEILDLFGRLFGIPKATRQERIDQLLDRVGLSEARNRQLRKFSKGMLQRLGIAQALINDPELLVLDEPLSGLDPMGRKEIRDIVIEERKRGKSILFISHILSDIEHLCDRVAIISRGRIVKEGPLAELLVDGRRRTEITARGLSTEVIAGLATGGADPIDLGGVVRVVVDNDQVDVVVTRIIDAGGGIDQVQPHRDSLENLFLREAGPDA